MAEYIEREAAKKLIDNACAECREACEEFDGFYADCNQCLLHGVKNKLPHLPAANVREVVLCRDCIHNKGEKAWEMLGDTTADCNCGNGYPPLDWFCAYGKKREEN